MDGRWFARMDRLGDGSDRFGARRVGRWWVGSQPGGWVEQRVAQILQQAQPAWGHGEPAPAAARAVEHHPHQREAAGLAGSSADDLHASAGLPEGALDEIGVTDPLVVLGREAQGGGELLAVAKQALDCRG